MNTIQFRQLKAQYLFNNNKLRFNIGLHLLTWRPPNFVEVINNLTWVPRGIMFKKQNIECINCGNRYMEGTKWCSGCGSVLLPTDEKKNLAKKVRLVHNQRTAMNNQSVSEEDDIFNPLFIIFIMGITLLVNFLNIFVLD